MLSVLVVLHVRVGVCVCCLSCMRACVHACMRACVLVLCAFACVFRVCVCAGRALTNAPLVSCRAPGITSRSGAGRLSGKLSGSSPGGSPGLNGLHGTILRSIPG